MRLPPGTASHTRWPGVGTQCEGYPLIGAHPRRDAPPCCRFGWTALMEAAIYDHHEIVERLVVARADLNAKHSSGCALPLGPFRRRSSAAADGDADRALRLRRPAGPQRCTMRRATAAPKPPWRCSSAAPTRPSRTTSGKRPERRPTGPRAESARIGAGERLANQHNVAASSPRTTRRWRRCGRRHRPRAPPSARVSRRDATTRTEHCTDRVLRHTPTHPRHDVRVALRAIRRCCRTAAGRAGT